MSDLHAQTGSTSAMEERARIIRWLVKRDMRHTASALANEEHLRPVCLNCGSYMGSDEVKNGKCLICLAEVIS